MSKINSPTSIFNLKNIAIIFIGILTLFAVYKYFLTERSQFIVTAKHSQLTFSGKAYNPVISPDGKTFAYIEEGVVDKLMIRGYKWWKTGGNFFGFFIWGKIH